MIFLKESKIRGIRGIEVGGKDNVKEMDGDAVGSFHEIPETPEVLETLG